MQRQSNILTLAAAVLVAVSMLISASVASAALKKEDVEKTILDTMPPGSKVVAVEKAKYLPGFWEVAVITRSKLNVVYLNDDGKTAVAGAVFDIKAQRNFTDDRLKELSKNDYSELFNIDFAKLPLQTALVLGDPAKAKYKAAVFDDPD